MFSFNFDLVFLVIGIFSLVRLQSTLLIVPRLFHGLKLIVPKQFGFSRQIASDRSADISMEEIFTFFNLTMIQLDQSSKISQQVLKLQSYYSSLNIFLQIFLLTSISQVVMNLWTFIIPPTFPILTYTLWYTIFTLLAYLLSIQLGLQILFHSVVKFFYDLEIRMSIVPAALMFIAGMFYTQVFKRRLLPLTTLSDLSQHTLTLLKYVNPQIERVFPISTMNFFFELFFLSLVCLHSMLYVIPGFRRSQTLVKMTLGKSFERVKNPLMMFSLWLEYILSLFLVLVNHPIIVDKMHQGFTGMYYQSTVLSLPTTASLLFLSSTTSVDGVCGMNGTYHEGIPVLHNVTVTTPFYPTSTSSTASSSTWYGYVFTTPMDMVILIQIGLIGLWVLCKYANSALHWQSYLDYSIETISLLIMNNSPAAAQLAKAQQQAEPQAEPQVEESEGGKTEESVGEATTVAKKQQQQAVEEERERMQLQQILVYTIESRSGNLVVIVSQSIAFTLSILLLVYVLYRQSTLGLGISVWIQESVQQLLFSAPSAGGYRLELPTQRGIATVLEHGLIAYRSIHPTEILSYALLTQNILGGGGGGDGTCAVSETSHTPWTLLYAHYAPPSEAIQSFVQHLLAYVFMAHLAVNFFSLLLWLIYPQLLKNTISSPRRLQ